MEKVALLTDAQLRQPGRVEVVVAASGAHKHVCGQLLATRQHCSRPVGGAAGCEHGRRGSSMPAGMQMLRCAPACLPTCWPARPPAGLQACRRAPIWCSPTLLPSRRLTESTVTVKRFSQARRNRPSLHWPASKGGWGAAASQSAGMPFKLRNAGEQQAGGAATATKASRQAS